MMAAQVLILLCHKVFFRSIEMEISVIKSRAILLNLIVVNTRKRQKAKYSQIIIETFVIKIEFITSIFFKGIKMRKKGIEIA